MVRFNKKIFFEEFPEQTGYFGPPTH
jgi:hypothetical protein